MKFMKLGSKPDTFEAGEDNNRYVGTELPSDITVTVGTVNFHLHKFPLLSKCARLQNLVAAARAENSDEVHISDIPGGATAFEICAKFCYSMGVTLNAHNVVTARCAAEYLGMHESMEKGNLIYKVDVFLNSSIFHSWKDSIIVLQSTKSLLPWSDELKLVSRCVDSLSSKASVDTSRVDWPYTYNRKKLPEENGNDQSLNGIINYRAVPKDWWVEDLCDLEVDLYKRVISRIKSKGRVCDEVIGDALKAYAYRKLRGLTKHATQTVEFAKYRLVVDTIVCFLPSEKGSVSCSFLIKMLKAALLVESDESVKTELIVRIGQQLEEATASDLLIQGPNEEMMYDVDLVQKIVREFLNRDLNCETRLWEGDETQEITGPGILSEASKLMVAKVIDAYLADVAKDPNLSASKFLGLAEMVSCVSRPSHDALYRAIDTYLKDHPDITKSERKKLCRLIDCKKLSVDACMHAVQNERLPMRVIVQVLFFEQVRASSGASTPDLPMSIRELNNNNASSRPSTATNVEEDWDAVATAEELRALKSELAALRSSHGGSEIERSHSRHSMDRVVISKMRGLLRSKKVFTRLWSSKTAASHAENSGSDSSDSPSSAHPEDVKSTPRNRRISVS